jgi:hypothetical protein
MNLKKLISAIGGKPLCSWTKLFIHSGIFTKILLILNKLFYILEGLFIDGMVFVQ